MFSPEQAPPDEDKHDRAHPQGANMLQKLQKAVDVDVLMSSFPERLAKVDFKVLQDICSGILRKSGVDEKRAEKISATLVEKKEAWDIFLTGDFAQRTPEGKIIFFKSFYTKFEKFVSTLIHEAIHEISDNFTHDSDSDEDYVQRAGVSERVFAGKLFGLSHYKDLNNLLNEGITQLVAEAVTHEYFRRQGVGIEDIRLLERNIYTSGKAVVELLTKSISYKTDVPEDVAFKAIVRAMFNYDYDEFVKMVQGDPELEELISHISTLGIFELENILGRMGLVDKQVNLNKLKVKGLEDVFENVVIGQSNKRRNDRETTYFNPLYGDLHS